MNCEEAKQLLREGRAAEAAGHVAACDDCREFAEAFADDAGLLSLAMSVPAPEAGALERAFAAAAAELPAAMPVAVPARPLTTPARAGLAAAVAAVFAPVLLVLNYLVARFGDAFLSSRFTTMAGSIFFGFYIIEAVAVIALLYGALPFIFAAARNTLRTNVADGGFAI